MLKYSNYRNLNQMIFALGWFDMTPNNTVCTADAHIQLLNWETLQYILTAPARPFADFRPFLLSRFFIILLCNFLMIIVFHLRIFKL